MVLMIGGSSDGDRGRRTPYVIVRCERGGHYVGKKVPGEDDQRPGKRSTGSKKCNCPFKLKGTREHKDDEKAEWKLDVHSGIHNHNLFENLHGHSYAGRLSKEDVSFVHTMKKAMVKPRAILRALKQKDPSNVTGMKTVYNTISKLNFSELDGRSQVQSLFVKLKEDEYLSYHRSNELNAITDLFWIHPKCIKLAQSYPYVFVIDCTYKTNRYGLPFLEILGFTCTNKTFSIAFAYLDHEKTENFEWALRCLKEAMTSCPRPNCIVTDRDLGLMKAVANVYPSSHHLLCRWHVNKNIVANCKKLFPKDITKWKQFQSSFSALIERNTIEEFNEEWEDLKRTFIGNLPAIEYVANSWLDPYKERLVSVWTNKYTHFGTYTSNRVEGAHGRMKRDVRNSTGTFVDLYTKVHNQIVEQHNDIKASFEVSKNTYEHTFKTLIYNELRGSISKYALQLLKVEVDNAKLLQPSDMGCSCAIRTTHSLPCRHELHEYVVVNKCPIPLELIGSYWKHMSMEPVATTDQVILPTIDEELSEYQKLFECADLDAKTRLRNHLRHFTHPEKTNLTEPSEKVVSKGRPAKNRKDKSSTRDKSHFEYVEPKKKKSKQASCSPKLIPVLMRLRGHSNDSFNTIPTEESGKSTIPTQESFKPLFEDADVGLPPGLIGKNKYIDTIHPRFRMHVREIINVGSDGHCGFRAVASMMGFGEDEWGRVRDDMLRELTSNFSTYTTMHRGEETVRSMQAICLTFLPLSSDPKLFSERQEHGMAFVDNCHFVHVVLNKNCPIPPIADYWYRCHDPKADGWKPAEMDGRITAFRELIGQNVATRESFEIITISDNGDSSPNKTM
ncbi:PREDICTED: protein FAR1-RELATED SEQUENCE 5-like [Erythranthe guttata]|uniref:protein FAR1-RELATED SEQUENCE 5-like n=1 Tax=Erythranthe guttata TaxID=4155 RepID=UPI00064D8CAE|nr:PREDICTED: protein FAR1-RELATED SEQUENCE 5-like [Erythranthe guttata]|eukprot:XP_012829137.1 PREDICTED: protein FAR1-RELATED SEQUENCE 5-like [Erythranthe guttata]